MKVLVFGAGAVGLGISSCLLRANVQVDIIARDTTVSALREGGLVRTGIFSDYTHSPDSFGSYTDVNEVSDKNYDYILIASKAYSVEEIIKIIHRSDINLENTKFVLLNNGWGTHLIASHYFPDNKIYNARIITGFIRKQHNHVEITVHADSILIGSFYQNNLDTINNLCDAISIGGIPCRLSRNLSSYVWSKLIYNAALNPLGAILEVTYGELASMQETTEIMNLIIEEAFMVMSSCNIKCNWNTAQEYREVFYNSLVPSTKEHKSSMLQDILLGKETEIEFINGVIVKLGHEQNIKVPTNLMISRLVDSKHKVVNKK